MIDIAVRDLNKYYGSNHVIKGISFEIKKGEKVGLLGKNGCGKTTLFKILAGDLEYESGNIIKADGKKIEVLEQIPEFLPEATVEMVLQTAFDEVFEIAGQMRKLENIIQQEHSQEMLERYGRLQTKYEALDGYECDNKINRICNGMNINTEMRNQLFVTLSGGEKTRVNLARILLRDTDILLLDEPTNHLDLPSVEWMEKYLESYGGTVVIISHDRCFLDNAISRIIELEDGKAGFYEGNYSWYTVEKQKRFSLQLEKYEQQQKKIGQLEYAAKRMHEWAKNADNPDMHRRAFSIEKRMERMEKVDRPVTVSRVCAEFQNGSFSGEEMVVLKDIGKEYDGKPVFENINLSVFNNDKIALIGENGCGKSTLVKLVMQYEKPDSGEVKTGSSLKAAYMPQTIVFEDDEMTMLDTLRYFMETSEEKARSILAAFNFKGADVFKKTGSLSGGEKSRLKMCMLMQKNNNLLILDEPTNHLDIASREWIEKALSNYKGTLLFISHDRYFLDKFANRIWLMVDGRIRDFKGTYREYCEWNRKAVVQEAKQKSVINDSKIMSNGGKVQKGNIKKEQSQAPERQLEGKLKNVEELINRQENRIKEIDALMLVYSDRFDQLKDLFTEKSKIESELEELYSNWEDICSSLNK